MQVSGLRDGYQQLGLEQLPDYAFEWVTNTSSIIGLIFVIFITTVAGFSNFMVIWMTSRQLSGELIPVPIPIPDVWLDPDPAQHWSKFFQVQRTC